MHSSNIVFHGHSRTVALTFVPRDIRIGDFIAEEDFEDIKAGENVGAAFRFIGDDGEDVTVVWPWKDSIPALDGFIKDLTEARMDWAKEGLT